MPLIGVTTSIAPAGKGPERAVLNSAYLHAVQDAGGTPVPLTPQLSFAARETLLARLDGILLTGGGDVDPALYNEAPHRETAGVSQARDVLELAVLEWAFDHERPIFAICRGMQLLNVARGGSLHQHVPDVFGTAIAHAQEAAGFAREEPTHVVTIGEGSALARVVGRTEVRVNSLHHQAVNEPGRGLEVVAVTDDGVIEGLEMPGYGSWMLGVQWHPEEMAPWSVEARRLFDAFVAACGTPD